MQLAKAIELLAIHRDLNLVHKNPDLKDSMNLGIEALKRIQFLQDPHHKPKEPPLPGETPPKPLQALGFNTGDDESP